MWLAFFCVADRSAGLDPDPDTGEEDDADGTAVGRARLFELDEECDGAGRFTDVRGDESVVKVGTCISVGVDGEGAESVDEAEEEAYDGTSSAGGGLRLYENAAGSTVVRNVSGYCIGCLNEFIGK